MGMKPTGIKPRAIISTGKHQPKEDDSLTIQSGPSIRSQVETSTERATISTDDLTNPIKLGGSTSPVNSLSSQRLNGSRTAVNMTSNNATPSNRPRAEVNMRSNNLTPSDALDTARPQRTQSATSLDPTTPVVDVNDDDHYFAKRVRQAEEIASRTYATDDEAQKAQQNLEDCLVACALYESERDNITHREAVNESDADYNALSIRASKALMQRLVDDWHNTTKRAEAGYMQRLNQLGFIEMVLKKEEAQSISAGRADDPGNDGIASIGSDDGPDADNPSSQVVAASVGRDEVFLAVKSFTPAPSAPEITTPAPAVSVKLMGEKGKIANISDPNAFNTLSEDDKNKAALQQARMYLMKYYKPGAQIVIRGRDADHKARIEAALVHCLRCCQQNLDQTRIVGSAHLPQIRNSFDTWLNQPATSLSLQDDQESLVAVVNQRTTKEALVTMRGTILDNNQFVEAHEPPERLDEQRDDTSHSKTPGGGG